jgi:hypothetical protein
MMRNPERLGVGIIIIIIVSFTPIIAWMVTSGGLNVEPYGRFVIRIVVGVITYVSAVYAISGLKDPEKKKPKEGKLTINYYLVFIGIFIIFVAWFTDISEWIVSTSGLTLDYELGGSEYANTSIPARLIVSGFTFLGAYLIKKSSKREPEVYIKEQSRLPNAQSVYEHTMGHG